MRVVECGSAHAERIDDFGSHRAASVHLGSDRGDAHVFTPHFEPGGAIERHRAGFDPLFRVVAGEGWVEGDSGERVSLRPGQAGVLRRGDMHAKGVSSG